ncbi:MAG: hypothetical protein LC808_43865, partial [Actinobacteria bacterium]|nr:hypothetical protein [Actinomycetota bacterium]
PPRNPALAASTLRRTPQPDPRLPVLSPSFPPGIRRRPDITTSHTLTTSVDACRDRTCTGVATASAVAGFDGPYTSRTHD